MADFHEAEGILGVVKDLDNMVQGNPTLEPGASEAAFMASNQAAIETSSTAVLEAVKSLDTALGYPFAASDATTTSSLVSDGGAMAMSIPNEVVILGGVLVAVFVGGTAFLSFQREDSETEPQKDGPSKIDDGGLRQLEAGAAQRQQDLDISQPKLQEASFVNTATVNGIEAELEEAKQKEAELKQMLEMQEAEQKEAELKEMLEMQEGKQKEEAERKEKLTKSLSEKLESKTEELTNTLGLLKEEQAIRVKTESKLFSITEANQELMAKYEEKRRTLAETAENLDRTQTQLQMEIKKRQEVQSELEDAAESNRRLEDQYELEQNAKNTKIKELDATRNSLDTTQKRLTKTLVELSQAKTELDTTSKKLVTTSNSLDMLEEERRSLRTLGRRMWNLSRDRVKHRIRKAGNRFRRKEL